MKGIKSKTYLQKWITKVNHGNQTTTNLRIIVNTFNSFFWLVAPSVQSDVPFSYEAFFISKEEIIKKISTSKPNKLAGPNLIAFPPKSYVYLKMIHWNIFQSFWFATGIFSDKLKVVILIHKKNFKTINLFCCYLILTKWVFP